jgi:hypothetical protein
LQIGNHCLNRQIDPALEIHRVHAGRDALGTFSYDRMGQYGRSRSAVASLVGRLRRNFAHHLGAHVLELVV